MEIKLATVGDVLEALSVIREDMPVLFIDHDYGKYWRGISVGTKNIDGKDFLVMGHGIHGDGDIDGTGSYHLEREE